MFLRKVCTSSSLPLLNLCRYNHVKSNSTLEVKEVEGVRYITMIDNKTRNCLSNQMMDNLINAIQTNENDVELRAIVLASSGPAVFSAGHNLKELSPDHSYESHHDTFKKCHEMIKTVIQSPLPVIAKVDGLAAGNITLKFLIDKNNYKTLYYFSCWTPANGQLRYRRMQPEKHILNTRSIVWNILQYSRNRLISCCAKDDIKLHVVDWTSDKV